MPAMHVNLTRPHEEVGREMGADRLPIIHTAADWMVDAMEHGMTSGATSLMVLIPARVDDLDVLVAAETSLQCWMMAASVLAGAHRDEVERPGWARLSAEARALFLPRIAEAVRRAIPAASPGQADEAAAMIIDAYAADEPPPGSTHG